MTQCPVGMMRLDELAHQLTALSMTGGCDERTLEIVAQSIGIGDYYRKQTTRLSVPVVEVVRLPELTAVLE